jgi:SAM-dependent methyltransferase
MLPHRPYGRVLDIGCGTGFFILNLWQDGFVERAAGCDLSPGMLAACEDSARALGCPIELRTGDAEGLPYKDGTFDLVVGHAVLHHVPDPAAALREVHRVLAPGGALLIAGEPSRIGDRMAKAAGRLAWRSVRAVARAVPALRRPHPPPGPSTEEERVLRDLEWVVDLHAFDPADLAMVARAAGFRSVRVETEELLSSLAGWTVRTLEAELPPSLLGPRWASFVYRMYRALYALDQRLLYPSLPQRWFYNVLLYGEKQEADPPATDRNDASGALIRASRGRVRRG